MLNKTLMFNTNKIDEEIIMDMMIDTLNNKTNDEFYIEHPVDSNYFTSKRVEGRYEISTKSNISTNLKTDPNSILFSEEKIDEQLLKKLKKSKYVKDSLFLQLIILADNRLEGWFYWKTGNWQVDFI